MRAWATRALVLSGVVLLMATKLTEAPGIELLDQENGFAGIAFGSTLEQVPGLAPTSGGLGKRWRHTKLYRRPATSVALAGEVVMPDYWFRNQHFIGVTIDVSRAQGAAVLGYLKQKYGPSQIDSAAVGTEYWLGKRTYILFEPTYPKSRGWELHIAELAMLNEQVVETAVRRQARAKLGWQPDSLGLPRQFPR